MNRAYAGRAYRQTATHTSSPGQLVLMLYDGAIAFLHRALDGFQCEDPLEHNQTVHNNIQRAQAIIQELDVSLDMDKGGEFSTTMRRLYDYFGFRLHESNVEKQDAGTREVIRHMTVLREAWAEMLQKQECTSRPSDEPQAFSATG